MTLCIWVKHPDIKKCILSIASPEILCNNIETGAVLSDGCPVPEMFVPQWLQGWFNPNVATRFREKIIYELLLCVV